MPHHTVGPVSVSRHESEACFFERGLACERGLTAGLGHGPALTEFSQLRSQPRSQTAL